MMDKQKRRIRTVLEVVMVIAALAMTAYLLHKHTPTILKLLEGGNVSDVEQYIKGQGQKGRVVLILLQIIETVSIVLPAMPVYICAGAIYGKLQGILMCWLTNVAMNLILFSAARKMKTTMAEFPKLHKNPKLERLMQETKYPDRIVFLMCLLPIIPNGMIPYISAQTNVSALDFTKALAIGCLPGIAVFVSGGDLLLSEHFHVTLPILIVATVALLIAFLFRDKLTAWIEASAKRFLGIDDAKA